MNGTLKTVLTDCAEGQSTLDGDTALQLLQCDAEDMTAILQVADAVRRRKFGQRITLCSIVNARSGDCGEDCSFCAQSLHHEGNSRSFPLLSTEDLLAAYDAAADQPIRHFGVVTSGETLTAEDLQSICGTIAARPQARTGWCASFGNLDVSQFLELKAAGLVRYHHNLETARSFFPQICTTHSYDSRIATVRAAKEAGLQVCCGGLLGLGETLEQRVEFALQLAELQVDQIPLNFLVPIPGTPLAGQPLMKALEILRTIAMFRLVCPEASLKVAAGRVHLNRLQSMIFYAGCNAMMIGDLLTIAGGPTAEDLEMLEDLELEVDY